MSKKLKLEVMRILAMLAMIAGIGLAKIGVVGKTYLLPCRWLLHYLRGSGRNMIVPDGVVLKATHAFAKAVMDDDYGTLSSGKVVGRFCVNHSTLYKGRGFHERPTLFYLCGGFTFSTQMERGFIRVTGSDEYDWHPSDSMGNYFCSPLGSSRVLAVIIKAARKLFGEEYFPERSWPTMENEPCVSNKLWDDLHLVGASGFTTTFSTRMWDESEYYELARVIHPDDGWVTISRYGDVLCRMKMDADRTSIDFFRDIKPENPWSSLTVEYYSFGEKVVRYSDGFGFSSYWEDDPYREYCVAYDEYDDDDEEEEEEDDVRARTSRSKRIILYLRKILLKGGQ